MKQTIIIIGLLGGFIMSSCSVTKTSYSVKDIKTSVEQYPTVADMEVLPKAERKDAWNFLFFRYGQDNLDVRTNNLVAELLEEKNADVLLEPQTVFTKKSFGRRTLSVTGYPAKLSDFRKAECGDLEALSEDVSPEKRKVYNVSGSNVPEPLPEPVVVNKKKTDVIIRAGYASNKMVASGKSSDALAGYSVGVEFNTFIRNGFYWNTGVLFGSRGGDGLFTAHCMQIPIGVGYKINLTRSFAVDPHFAPFMFSVDLASDLKGYASSYNNDSADRCDVGMMMGVGVWLKNVNLDFSYQRGFMDAGLYLGKQSNLIVRLGIAF